MSRESERQELTRVGGGDLWAVRRAIDRAKCAVGAAERCRLEPESKHHAIMLAKSELAGLQRVEALLSSGFGRREDGRGPLRYIYPGEVTETQREVARASELYRAGDMVLVWVNEGDLLIHALPATAAQPPPADGGG